MVVLSAPSHLRDIYVHSSRQLRAGEMHEFLECNLGVNSILVLERVNDS